MLHLNDLITEKAETDQHWGMAESSLMRNHDLPKDTL